MTSNTLPQFRDKLYGVFSKRADASMDLIDAIARAPHIDAPVALSLSQAFRRAFSSIYETLDNG